VILSGRTARRENDLKRSYTVMTATELLREDAEIGNKLDTLSAYYEPGKPAYIAAAETYLGRRKIVRQKLESLRKPDAMYLRVEALALRGVV
jgi:hypothetical protein